MKIKVNDKEDRLDEWLKNEFGEDVYKKEYNNLEKALESTKKGRAASIFIMTEEGPESFEITRL